MFNEEPFTANSLHRPGYLWLWTSHHITVNLYCDILNDISYEQAILLAVSSH